MPRGKTLTSEEKAQIRALRTAKHSLKNIADQLKRSKSCVYDFLKRDATGITKKRCGRPQKLSPQDKRNIKRNLSKKSVSAKALKLELNLNVSVSTITRAIHKTNCFEYKKRKVAPLITENHRSKRLEWAMAYNRFYPHEWDMVVWSDEKKFNGDGPDGWSYYWHDVRQDEKIFSKRKNGGFSVMVWACFSRYGKGPLVFVDGNLNSEGYVHILQSHLLPFLDMYHPEQVIFQQDNAPIHVSKRSKGWFNEEGIQLLDWPAHSPDLNPIENLWSILAYRVYADCRQFDTVGELKAALLEEWSKIDIHVLCMLTRGMPRRCMAVIRANGKKTKY